ncbi:MAG: cysteine desulfurase [Planctomycetes bacterium]|nr:cysteine desulfurase [Planctomycetota bacterium]
MQSVKAIVLMDEIYLDNHATTRTDPRVVDGILPWMLDEFANSGSTTHAPGRRVAAKLEECRANIAQLLGAEPEGVVFTSGATESVNLAIFGVALHPRQKRRKIVSVVTEHWASIDSLKKLERLGFEVIRLGVEIHGPESIGMLPIDEVELAIDGDTALVNVMLGNNEIGTLQPFSALAALCRQHGAVLHTDATQAVGKVSVNIAELGADLLSFSSHKFYGPKGIGGLVIHPDSMSIPILPQILGGGQQQNLRSGTLNSVGIVGTELALTLAVEGMVEENARISRLREMLWSELKKRIEGLQLNGPLWNPPIQGMSLENSHPNPASSSAHFVADPHPAPLPARLPGNLNVCFPKVDGQSLMLRAPQLAVSSGSACTSSEPHPSHVLLAIGKSEDEARGSLRFGIGRFNTESEILRAADVLGDAYEELSRFVA